MKKILMTVLLIVLVAACSPITQQAKQELAKPINCATADGDLRVLQSEKSHVAAQIAIGVTSVVPAGLVLGIVTGTEKDKLEYATGDYNKMLDNKIAEIKQKCNK